MFCWLFSPVLWDRSHVISVYFNPCSMSLIQQGSQVSAPGEAFHIVVLQLTRLLEAEAARMGFCYVILSTLHVIRSSTTDAVNGP